MDFVRDELKCVVEGKTIPTVDVLITTQNWAQFTETWDFQNIDKNAEPPFIGIVRTPEVTFGNNPSIMLSNIPNRRQYFYMKVPTWDGQRNGFDIYKIPQPIPVDITYDVRIFAYRQQELNKFNATVLKNFQSRQAYTVVNGHYIPIVLEDSSDESQVTDLNNKRFYVQLYNFNLQGFLSDPDDYIVTPAISRTFTITENI
jgi:hypothetical protein